ncbi:MAG: hypothetical protein A2X61_14170 [Ignavibacteria bacterium GWB2_35_12]|nr:MAG: hypothetical protein A2X61_14170 [Ignavibacteria bacterium GWB2_35_12]OGU96214.1 MAG: hypothetical protein A2220_12520 [Ignavibacteria bacterium RIFOXYA2_FULL_35_10]OGV23175.1 MAG: hypothetical protein A2475_17500 [Ignavibacteria bacterium RIFOXYC2_FULL_35_21]
MRIKIKILLSILISFLFCGGLLNAQDVASRNELESVLRLFKNYRFGYISVWELNSVNEIQRVVRISDATGTVKTDDACVKKTDPSIVAIIQDGVRAGDEIESVQQTIMQQMGTTIDPKDMECIFDYFKNQLAGETTRLEKAFVITNRVTKGTLPDTIIALIVSYDTKDMDLVLRSVSPTYIYTYDELKATKLDTGFSANNFYDLVMNSFMQANVINKTLEAQGLGTNMKFAPKAFGLSKSIVMNENDASTSDIQQFMRISDVQPANYGLNQHEVILSPDLISWRKYEPPGYWEYDTYMIDSLGNSNANLPTLGLELKYGIEEVNFPSFWSERMSISAIWQSVKLGVILPTDGWASMTKDVFSQTRTLTHGGAGVTGAFDFPFKVVPQSGIFHFNFGYVFGDAAQATYKGRKISAQKYTYEDNNLYNDYLIRGNGSFHYTFGVKVDEDYWFRFGIGASMYTAEKWFNVLDSGAISKMVFKKMGDETVMGISGRIEFMATNAITPFGGGVQYFDEALYGNIWLQVPVIGNSLALRLDTKAFFPAFRKTARAWEVESMFIPMARIIVSF